MERIKQALDKARGERDRGLGKSPMKPDGGAKGSGAAVAEDEIRYSQTRVVELDKDLLHQNHIIFGDEDREGLTAYKMLRTQVLQRMVARDWNALAITSPAAGDGKTLTAVNLAISLARELHHTVLLVDLDLRNPSIHKYLGFEPEFGIDDYLLHGASLSDVMINPGIERLVVIPAREVVMNSSELLATPAMGNLVQELKSRYPSRMVLFDVPPLLASDDALSFSPHIDAFLVVLRESKTTKDEVEHALQLIKNVELLGTVLNGSQEKIATYY